MVSIRACFFSTTEDVLGASRGAVRILLVPLLHRNVSCTETRVPRAKQNQNILDSRTAHLLFDLLASGPGPRDVVCEGNGRAAALLPQDHDIHQRRH